MPLRVGDQLPTFELPDPASGKIFDSRELAGSDALILFLRGTWCPYCREQLAVLSARCDALAAAGVRVVAISCQSAESLKRYSSGNPMPFPVLADESRATAKAFGVHYWWRWDGFNLAHPSLFIVDREGKASFSHVGKSMNDLPVGFILDKFAALLANGPKVGGS